jgi:hypothetical protein
MMILTNQTQKRNFPTKSRSSLYKETITLREIANQQGSQPIEDEGDLGINFEDYIKIIASLSGIALLTGILVAALTQ